MVHKLLKISFKTASITNERTFECLFIKGNDLIDFCVNCGLNDSCFFLSLRYFNGLSLPFNFLMGSLMKYSVPLIFII